MKVYEGAKQLGIKSKELIERMDGAVDHHLDTIPEEMLESLGLVEKKIEEAEPEPTQTVDSAEEVVIKEVTPKKDGLPEGVTPEQVWHACTGIGSRHKLWKYRHLGRKPEK